MLKILEREVENPRKKSWKMRQTRACCPERRRDHKKSKDEVEL